MILVRHAESEWNRLFGATRIDPEIPDPALTARGREQVARLIDTLARVGLRRLLVSPYRRTLETAAAVAGALDLEIEIEPLVRERCYFSCDLGTPRSQLAQDWPGIDFGQLDEYWWGRRGESEASLGARAAAFRERTRDLEHREATAVITHWGFIRAYSGIEVDNAACVRIGAETLSGV